MIGEVDSVFVRINTGDCKKRHFAVCGCTEVCEINPLGMRMNKKRTHYSCEQDIGLKMSNYGVTTATTTDTETYVCESIRGEDAATSESAKHQKSHKGLPVLF